MKNTVKNALSTLLALSLCLGCSLPARAYAPKIVDYALYTDVVAKINGHPLRSYNIGGYTAVVAEDLRGYGFQTVWNGGERTLRVTRALRNGEPEAPAVWPAYESERTTHKIGARAKPVYATDIVTYVAGKRVEAFNVNGETLVWFDDLAPFGAVVWSPDERVLALELGDPVAIALAPLIENVEAWKAVGGPDSGWEKHECRTGTLLVTRYTGTPHGSATSMLFVRKSGEPIMINDLLPAWPWGSGSYLRPRDIVIDEPDHRLTFITPVRELTAYPDGDVRDLGECRCTVDLLDGALLSIEPSG